MQAIGSDSNELQAIGSGSRNDCQMQVVGSDANKEICWLLKVTQKKKEGYWKQH